MDTSNKSSAGSKDPTRLSLHLVFEITGVIAAIATVVYVVVELI